MPTTICPHCQATITAGDPQFGAMITCNDCGIELEIILANPFEVDFPIDYWEVDDDDDDDGN